MYRNFLRHIPNSTFLIANLIFWLILNTVSSFHTYRMSLHYERPAIWSEVWLSYLPWWGNWILIAPLIIATTAIIKFDTKHILKFIAINCGLMLLVLGIYWFMTLLEVSIMEPGDISLDVFKKSISELLLSPLHMDFLVYMAVLGSGYALSYYKQAKQKALETEQLAKQLIEAELHSLKSQLNPHFLFNTLNTVSGLIRLDDKKNAVKALSELSLMLRKILENNSTPFVTLSQEVEFINSYLTIQKMRFSDKLATDATVAPDCLDINVPFMLIQPLVENAVQHGSQLESNKNTVKLNIYKKSNQLHVLLINKIPKANDHKGFGIGLKTCRERMKKLYNNNFSLTLTELSDGYFETYLSLPIRNELD